MLDPRDSADEAQARADFNLELALRAQGLKCPTGRPRIVLEFCESCGNAISLARREANIVNDITQCIACAEAEETIARRYG